MKTIEIKANLRDELGKKDTKRLRKEGNVPCVMYGGEENIHFYAPENSFNELIYTPSVYIVKLGINGKDYLAIRQDIQFHPVTDAPVHIDFVQVSEDKPVVMNIPVKVSGESPGIMAGGKLRLKRRSLKVKGLLADLPDVLNIDISRLTIGMSIKVHELSYDNLELLDPQRAMIVAVVSSRMAVKDTEAGEAEEAEEAEEAAAEGGETEASAE